MQPDLAALTVNRLRADDWSLLQAQVQQIVQKLNELMEALRRN